MTRILGGAMLGVALLAFPAQTLAGNAPNAMGVTHAGKCTGASTSKIKLTPDGARIEVQFEVDQNRVGKLWNVKLFHNGNLVFTGQRRTLAPSGSFELRRFVTNRAGVDHVTGRARNPRSGEVCTATASI